MGHIDYDSVSTLDALVGISDAGARATLIRLRDRLAAACPGLEERWVVNGMHRKPAIGLFAGGDAVLHVFPEAGVGLGLHVALPLRQSELALIHVEELSPWLREQVAHARAEHNMLWLELTLRMPSSADELMPLIERRIDLLPHRRPV